MDLNLDLYLQVLRGQRDQAIEANALFQAQIMDLSAKNTDLQKRLDDSLSAAAAPTVASPE
ncbi:MAG: hypothetical protein JWN23_1539 [Rhodocyclales bacterium]|nr:hypothetical protein [Rhodocyclales bacterium]